MCLPIEARASLLILGYLLEARRVAQAWHEFC